MGRKISALVGGSGRHAEGAMVKSSSRQSCVLKKDKKPKDRDFAKDEAPPAYQEKDPALHNPTAREGNPG